MPAKSKAQFRLMQAAAHGKLRKKGGPSKAVAQEFVSGQSPKGLPEKVSKKYDGEVEEAIEQSPSIDSYLLGGRR